MSRCPLIAVFLLTSLFMLHETGCGSNLAMAAEPLGAMLSNESQASTQSRKNAENRNTANVGETSGAEASETSREAAAPKRESAAGTRLERLCESAWDRTLQEFPVWASELGDLRFNDRWRDLSPAALSRFQAYQQGVLNQLAEIPRDELSATDRVNYRLLEREYRESVDGHRFGWHYVPLNQREGIQDAGSVADSLRFETVKDYEDWLARMRSFPEYMDQTLALMQTGVDKGIVHARIVMERVPAQIKSQIVDDPADSLFYKPFRQYPASIPGDTRRLLNAAALRSIREDIVPAYRKMLKFFNEVYLPACFDRAGAWQLPDGQAFYAHVAKKYTTTELSPREIHEIGLAEVKRIRKEMDEILLEVEWKGSFPEFLEHLRTNREFYCSSANELLQAYQDVCRRVDPQLPKLFKRLPRIPYGIEAIPQHIAPDTTTAYYRPPSADGRRGGTYFVNVYRPETRPKYEMEALSLHESVPGHHLQIALAMELEALPEFRRYGGYTAFVEGWALYSEKLGYEMGLYRDPYSRFGQLTYEMWRAVRLVVDTGMHSLKWSRQEAIDFFKANTAKTELDIVNEVDRYIAWPGQALAYKMGELRISALRKEAETTLGDRFDVRDFHDVVLRDGAVTLDILEDNVRAWIRQGGG